VDQLTTASPVFDRAERAELVRWAIDSLEPFDREIISLRIYEGLANNGAAAVPGLAKAPACNRYIRAAKRLRVALQAIPGLVDSTWE
jgi:DNA-directed RNA polymerase specialized sigma24 family protein